LVDAGGGLALPVLDYEHDGPEEISALYDAARPPFAETGSPRLPLGLTLGAQLFWQFHRFPEAARTASIIPYPQYWSFRLSGARATEATSLGTHTDLWEPRARRFSSLVQGQGWDRLMPPIRRAADVLGTVTPEVAAATGLDPATPVFCGIHDSNASLLPHLVTRRPPFSVVSTGTWVVSMAIGGRGVALDPARDTLINVNAFGDPVPSGRFMGGREWQRLMQGRDAEATPADEAAVLARGIMLLPAVEPGSGPYPGRAHAWTVPEAELTDGERAVAASWYLALMTATCLGIIGAEGPACVEGPFANNRHFVAMLVALVPGGVIAVTGASTGTSTGAALLALPPPAAPPGGVAPVTRRRPGLVAYAERWKALAAAPR
jgi:sugar (pentulose or hexulose) kinase